MGELRDETAQQQSAAKEAVTVRQALLVHAHSETDAFSTSMRNTIAAALREQGWKIIHSDLYAMRFNPVLSPADFPARGEPGHLTYALEQRHGYETGTIAPDIQGEIAKVLAADLLVFTFPLFWFSAPAILKGWFDRVFISGTFYGGRRIYGAGGLAGRRAMAAISLGGRTDMFGPGAIHGELENGMLRHFLRGTLGYVGLDVIAPFIAHFVPYAGDDDRRAMLAQLRERITAIDTLPLIEMPDLRHYDSSFSPLARGA